MRDDLHEHLADHAAEDAKAQANDAPERHDVAHARHPRVDPDLARPATALARHRELAPADPVHVRYRGQFAYVDGELAGGERLPLMRLRYGGSAHRWGTAIYVASTDSYESQIWFSSTIEEIFDLVCDLHVANAGP